MKLEFVILIDLFQISLNTITSLLYPWRAEALSAYTRLVLLFNQNWNEIQAPI